MKLIELITKVKEQNLSKDQLENYRDELSGLFAQMQLEMAEIEKFKAVYFTSALWGSGHTPDIEKKRQWAVTTQGLREIELKRYCLATKEMLNSLKSRLYSIY